MKGKNVLNISKVMVFALAILMAFAACNRDGPQFAENTNTETGPVFWTAPSTYVFRPTTSQEGSYQGLWEGTLNGVPFSIAFHEEHCFFEINSVTESLNFTVDENSGVITRGNNQINFSVVDDQLVITDNTGSNTLTRSTLRGASNIVNGLWSAPGGWALVFLYNRAYFIDSNGDVDYGIFTFNEIMGSFTTLTYQNTLSFFPSSTALTVEITERLGEVIPVERVVFSRMR